MRKAILDALKAKFQGVSESVLNRIADKLCKTVTTAEQVQTAVDGVTIQQVIEGYADSRATEASQTAVHTYEQKYGLKDGAKIEQPSGGGGSGQGGAPVQTPQGGGTDPVLLQTLQSLQESNKKLSERLDRMDSERTTSTRKQQLSGIIAKLPESLRKAYERTPVDGMTDEEIKGRIAGQMPLSEKEAIADQIIDNSKDLNDLYRQLGREIDRLKNGEDNNVKNH